MVYPRKVRLEEENTNKTISDDKKEKRNEIKSNFPDGVAILMRLSLVYDMGTATKARRRPVEEKEGHNQCRI